MIVFVEKQKDSDQAATWGVSSTRPVGKLSANSGQWLSVHSQKERVTVRKKRSLLKKLVKPRNFSLAIQILAFEKMITPNIFNFYAFSMHYSEIILTFGKPTLCTAEGTQP